MFEVVRPRGRRRLSVCAFAAGTIPRHSLFYLFPSAEDKENVVLDEAREPLALRTEAARATARFIASSVFSSIPETESEREQCEATVTESIEARESSIIRSRSLSLSRCRSPPLAPLCFKRVAKHQNLSPGEDEKKSNGRGGKRTLSRTMSSPSTSTSSLDSLPVRLLPLQLTPSGRPVLLPGEAERLIQDKADLVFVAPSEEERERGEEKGPKSLEDGVLRITTHRALWVDSRAAPSSGSSCSLPLESVSRVELRASRLWSSAKARLLVSVDGATGKLLLSSSSSSSRKIKVVAPGQAAIHAALQASLSAREWEKSESAEAAATSSSIKIDDAAVAAVVSMGFSASDAVAALEATAGSSLSGGGDPQEAALWLLERGEEEKKKRGQTTAAIVPSASSVGVGGLLRREAASAAAADAALESAFSDLGALMNAAAEMVELAKRYREESKARDERRRREKESSGGGGGGGGGGDGNNSSAASEAEVAADFEDELALLGVIASPVTRAATAGSEAAAAAASSSPSRFSLGIRKGDSSSSSSTRHLSLYIRELSAELSDFCQPLVAAAGGVLPLPDVYCLYNRARGAELAAPLDVVAAAEAWALLYDERAPLRLRRFGEGGGVLTVAAADQDDAAVCELLAALARGGEEDEGEEGEGKKAKRKKESPVALPAARARLLPAAWVEGLGRPLTPSDVAAAMRVPLPVAAAHLATAEAAGVLCRDDGDEGVRHFYNFFPLVEVGLTRERK